MNLNISNTIEFVHPKVKVDMYGIERTVFVKKIKLVNQLTSVSRQFNSITSYWLGYKLYGGFTFLFHKSQKRQYGSWCHTW
jgi:hypothetical protein